MDGQPVSFRSSQDAASGGIAMIFQEFSLISTLSVAQNVFLTREAGDGLGLIDDREMERRTRALFEGWRSTSTRGRSVDELPTAERQLTEIAKALSQDARVLIMDEPTSSLGRSRDRPALRADGAPEGRRASRWSTSPTGWRKIFEVADRITVLRDGRTRVDGGRRGGHAQGPSSTRSSGARTSAASSGDAPRRDRRRRRAPRGPRTAQREPRARRGPRAASGRDRWASPGSWAAAAASWRGRSSASTASTPARSSWPARR